MEFKQIKKGKIILFTGEGVLIFSLVPILAGLFSYLLDYGFGMPLFIAGLAVFAASFLLWLYGVKIYFTEYKVYNITAVYKNAKKYEHIPYCEIDDYKGEIDKLRAHYAATNDKNYNLDVCKMRKAASDCKNRERLLDLSVLTAGNIYYGCVACAHVTLYTPSYMNKYGTVFIIYSTDAYFDGHPEELKKISSKINDKEWQFNDNGEVVFNQKIPLDMTGGREVLLTTIIVKRSSLPMGYLTGDLLPVIALPDSSAFIVDSKYWTENLIGSFAFKGDPKKRGSYNAQKIALYEEKACADYAKELKSIRDKYVADPENDPYGFIGEDPFPMFPCTNTQVYGNTQVYYAYVLYIDEKANKPEYGEMKVPAAVIYSTDDRFKVNPYAYMEIAKKMMDKKIISDTAKYITGLREHGISPMGVPEPYSGGYNVFMAAMFVDKLSLPTCRIAGALIPVIRNEEDEDGWIYAADSKYWSSGFTYEFVYGNKAD